MKDAKLTLKLQEEAIAMAKRYAQKNGTSVSKLVEHFFISLNVELPKKKREISPITKSLSGIIKSDSRSGFNEKQIIANYLKKKYS